MNNYSIELENIYKVYELGEFKLEVLKNVSFKIRKGDFVALMGPSGAGKSTCLNILGCLDKPTSGSYVLDDIHTESLDDSELARVRNKKIGFVFQMFNLLARSSAIENVELPLLYAGHSTGKIEKAKKALELVGLGDRMHHKPNELSGGQQQRVAIARAIVNEPEIILADEPTGNLDSRSGEEIMKILDNLNKQGTTIILVTHDTNIAKYARTTIRFKDGIIEGQMTDVGA